MSNHLTFEPLLVLTASFRQWLRRRRTLRILAKLDERQLRDIGLMRDDVLFASPFKIRSRHKCYRALAGLDDTQLSNLSEHGLQVPRATRRSMHRSP